MFSTTKETETFTNNNYTFNTVILILVLLLLNGPDFLGTYPLRVFNRVKLSCSFATIYMLQIFTPVMTAEPNFLGNYVPKCDNIAWYVATTIGTNTYLYVVIPGSYLIHMRQFLARHPFCDISQSEALHKYQPHTSQHTYREVSVCTYGNLISHLCQTGKVLWRLLKDILINLCMLLIYCGLALWVMGSVRIGWPRFLYQIRQGSACTTLHMLTDILTMLPFSFYIYTYGFWHTQMMGSVRVIWSRFLDRLRQCSACTTLHTRIYFRPMLSMSVYTYIYVLWHTLCLELWQRLHDHLTYRHGPSEEVIPLFILFSGTSIEVCISVYVDSCILLGCLSSTLCMVLFACGVGKDTCGLLLASTGLCSLANMHGVFRVFMCVGERHYYYLSTDFHSLIFCSRGSVRASGAHYLVKLRHCSSHFVLMVNYMFCSTHFLLILLGNIMVNLAGCRQRTIGDWLVIYQTHSKEAQVRI